MAPDGSGSFGIVVPCALEERSGGHRQEATATGPALSILGFVWRSCRPTLLKGLVRVRPQDGPAAHARVPLVRRRARCAALTYDLRTPAFAPPARLALAHRLLPRAAAWSRPTRARARDRGRGVTLGHAHVLRRKARGARGEGSRGVADPTISLTPYGNRCKTAAPDDISAASRIRRRPGRRLAGRTGPSVWADRCAAPRRPARPLSAWVPASHVGSSMTLI